MANLTNLMTQIAAVQSAIVAPTGEQPATVFDPPPTQPNIFPCWINLETGTDEIRHLNSLREVPFLVDMHLVFGTADKQYSRRSARAWVAAVLDAFAVEGKLNGAATHAWIRGMEFGLLDLDIEYPQTDFLGVTFHLLAMVKEPFAYVA